MPRGRIILQDLVTRDYLATDRSWVSNCRQAVVFEHTYMALLEGLEYSGKHTQVVWCFRDPRMNMYMPVRPDDTERICPCDACPLARPLAHQ